MTKLEKIQEIRRENFMQGKYVDENSTEQEVDEVYSQMIAEKDRKKKEKEEKEKQSLDERLRIIREMQPLKVKDKGREGIDGISI